MPSERAAPRRCWPGLTRRYDHQDIEQAKRNAGTAPQQPDAYFLPAICPRLLALGHRERVSKGCESWRLVERVQAGRWNGTVVMTIPS